MSSLRINLWASPRNVSTALMYSFAQRSDCRVFDEPLYAHYLRVSDVEHPGQAEIMASMEQDGDKVIEQVILGEFEKPVLFFKQMTHHLVQINLDFLPVCKNVLLIRDPAAFITSYAKVIAQPSLADTGIQQQWELYQYLEKKGEVAAVLDAKELLLNPRKVLGSLCQRLGIDFEEAMLRWEAGARPEDGVWARYWYNSVHKSQGFAPFIPKEIEVPAHLVDLVEEAYHYYDLLFLHAIKA